MAMSGVVANCVGIPSVYLQKEGPGVLSGVGQEVATSHISLRPGSWIAILGDIVGLVCRGGQGCGTTGCCQYCLLGRPNLYSCKRSRAPMY